LSIITNSFKDLQELIIDGSDWEYPDWPCLDWTPPITAAGT